MFDTVHYWQMIAVVTTTVAIWSLLKVRTYEQRSLTDHLTGLHNRRWLCQYLDRLVRRATRSTKPVSILFVDLDRFKDINDSRGHLVGDRVLVRVAEIMQSCTRPTDGVFRYGGDEFIIVLPDTHLEDATLVAETLTKNLRDCSMMELALSRGFQTASVGVASTEESLKDAKSLIGIADERAYFSKQGGGDCVISKGV